MGKRVLVDGFLTNIVLALIRRPFEYASSSESESLELNVDPGNLKQPVI